MFTLEVTFRNSDEQGALFKGVPVDWFITSKSGDNLDVAVLHGTNTTVDGVISILINDVSMFEATKAPKPISTIFFHYTLGAKVARGIPIKLQNNPQKNIQSVRGSGIVQQPIAVIEEEVLLEVEPIAVTHVGYDITENNRTHWDWLIWETEGNSDPRYQRGGKTRNLGLYRLNYDLLRKAENGKDGDWQEVNDDHTLGGGWVKVAVLDSFDYSDHKELIRTFLPCFKIIKGKVQEPDEWGEKSLKVLVARSETGDSKPNTFDIVPPFIIMPFNYDDNGAKSNAIGKDLSKGLFPKVETKRLDLELIRWATASRSTISAFPMPPREFWIQAADNNWKLRPDPEEGIETPPYFPPSWAIQITGPPGGKTLCEFQKMVENKHTRYYSVKTGVQFVATRNQSGNKKDLLEENSIHAMNRSNLISATMNRLGKGRFKARYQLEVLCILLMKNPETHRKVASNPDGLENKEDKKPKYIRRKEIFRELEAIFNQRKLVWEPIDLKRKQREKENNEITETEALRKAGVELVEWVKNQWLKIVNETDKVNQIKFWALVNEIAENKLVAHSSKTTFSLDKLKVGGNESELSGDIDEPLMIETDKSDTFKVIHGEDHFKIAKKKGATEIDCIRIDGFIKITDYASFLNGINGLKRELVTANDDAVEKRRVVIEADKLEVGYDGIQIREVSEAAINDVWFPALSIPAHGKAFVESWATGQDWIKFWEDNYALLMGEAKGEMLLHFGMQHMTSNAQNFLIAFDRHSGGATGKAKYIILRDIGDTLYNDHIFKVLNDIDPLFKKEFEHESHDKFGVTLESELGTYTMPLMVRIGASIVYFYGPFVQGELAIRDDCLNILSNWCMAHNHAFLNYMREKIGYNDNWKSGEDEITEAFVNSLSKFSELAKDNFTEYSKIIVPTVLKLSSPSRWKLIRYFEAKCRHIPPHLMARGDIQFFSDVDEELKKAKQFVNAHEVLICAEVQDYIQSEQGKVALQQLHLGGSTSTFIPSPATSYRPKFCLKVLDEKGKPIIGFKLRFKRGDYETQWLESSDEYGEIPIYQYSFDECQINLPEYDDVYSEVSQIKSWKEVIFDRRGGFVAKIQFM
ncbi:MAG TPA: hypothetical protein PKY82_05690 [Pyrinomonadaceae bacterium]|nr:hypothetical protein [Pyrinomonadaceae bacterium]